KHVTGHLDDPSLIEAMKDVFNPESVRAQAISLACESHAPSRAILETLKELAHNDPSLFLHSPQILRLHLASALQRIPLDDRWPIAEALLAHGEDTSDPYLPLMYWYGFEPLVLRNVRKSIELIPNIQIPLVRQYIARRVVAVREGGGAPPASSAW